MASWCCTTPALRRAVSSSSQSRRRCGACEFRTSRQALSGQCIRPTTMTTSTTPPPHQQTLAARWWSGTLPGVGHYSDEIMRCRYRVSPTCAGVRSAKSCSAALSTPCEFWLSCLSLGRLVKYLFPTPRDMRACTPRHGVCEILGLLVSLTVHMEGECSVNAEMHGVDVMRHT
jgi:hypothetical protein